MRVLEMCKAANVEGSSGEPMNDRRDTEGEYYMTKRHEHHEENKTDRLLEQLLASQALDKTQIGHIEKEIQKMVQTLQDLQNAIAAIGAAVDADSAQDLLVVKAIEDLIAQINANPAAQDFTAQVAALSSVMDVLTHSNVGVQNELDKIGTKPPTLIPVIDTAGLTATGTVGVPFSFAISATQSPTSFTATGLPAALSLNTSSGLITGTPDTAGVSTASVTAVNAAGVGSAELVITIA